MPLKKALLWASLALLLLSSEPLLGEESLGIVERVLPVRVISSDAEELVIWEIVYHHDRKLITQHAVTRSKDRPFWVGQRIPLTPAENCRFYLIDYDRIDSVFSTEIFKDVNR